jgi:photosystem II stability/assembly factor-like uncharacterized protein
MRGWLAVFTVVALLSMAVVAHAEYGEWEYLHGLDPPGYSNASFLNLSVADENTLYTVGIHQTNFDQIVYGWSSTTGGTSWDPAVVMDFSGSMCDMMKMFTIIIAVESLDDNVGVFGGFGMLESCYENIPEPWCMFLCMLTLSPVIYVTNDGGETVTQAQVAFGFGKAVVAMDKAGDDVLIAVGGDELILRSTDKGNTWQDIPTLPEPELTYNDVDFIDDIVGFVTTGMSEPEPERTKGMTDEEYAWAIYRHRSNHIRWVHDGQYRLEKQMEYAQNGAPKGKGMNGQIFKTVDGGNSWEEVAFSYNESYGQIEMIDEDEGWVWASPLEGISPSYKILRTTDSGENWVDYTDRLPLQDLNGMAYGLMSFGFSPSGATGFVVGAGQPGFTYRSVLFYTADRGESWHLDESIMDWGHPMVAVDFVDDHIGYHAGADLSTYKYTQLNVPPIADAGPDQEVDENTLVTLDGSASYDPDGDPMTYAWVQLDGPSASLAGDDTVAPTFTADTPGELTFELTVDDGSENSSDEVVITVIEVPGDDDTADDDTADDDTTDDDTDEPTDDDDDDDAPAASGSSDSDDDDNGACGC